MSVSAQSLALAPPDDFNWWHSMALTGSGSTDSLAVPVAPLLETKWCAVHRISIGATPHTVRFHRPRHTLMVFDRGSFVDGERRIDSLRVAASGPLDRGVDVAPASSDFHAVAGPGSNVECIMVSVDDRASQAADGDRGEATLRPSVNLGGELLSPLTDRLRQLCRGDSQYLDRLYLEALVDLLFQEVKRTQGDAAGHGPRCAGGLSSHARRVIRDFLAENLDQRIDLETLAEQVGLSRFHFTRAFKVSFGIPPYQYLLNLRIRKAADMLKSTQMPITAIALEVGFSCSSEFARAFRQTMQCTPRQFRSSHQ